MKAERARNERGEGRQHERRREGRGRSFMGDVEGILRWYDCREK